jgi:NADH-quinone oxidoreductase subunit H
MFSSTSSLADWSFGTPLFSFHIMFILAVSSLNVYGIILAGWSSGTKYSYLGALRSASQMISYEVSIGLVLLPILFLTKSLNFLEIMEIQVKSVSFVLILLPLFMIFFISILAETNRAPFDLPEAEAELVAGYNVEYASIVFALFFLAEYSNMILGSTLIVLLFFSNVYTVFVAIKIVFVCYLIIIVRATFPRYRYNQLMTIGWEIFLPLTLGFFAFIVAILYTYMGA